MKTTVRYSTRCKVIHLYGVSTSFELRGSSLGELEKTMQQTVNAMCIDLAVTFDPIVKTTEEVIEVKGQFVQFVPKFPKNSLIHGEEQIDRKYFKPFKVKHCGSVG